MSFDPILWTKIKALQADVANILNGVIPEGEIPSQIIERATESDFDEIGKPEVLYIATKTNLMYRWDGSNSTYVLLGLNSGGTDYKPGDGITISSDNEISVSEDLLRSIAALQIEVTAAKIAAEEAKALAKDTAVWTQF